MQRIIATPLASRFCAPRQRSAQSPPDTRSPFRSALLHSDARSPFRSVLLHSDARSLLRPAAARHTRAAAFRSAFPALCRRTACGVPHFRNVSIYWQKNAGGCPWLFPNCLETFPFFDYSILPLFDFVNPFFSFFHFFSRRIAFFLRLHAISDCYILVRSSFLHSSHRTLRRRRSQRIVPQKRRARWAVLTNSALAVQDAPQSLQKGSPHAAYRT